MTNKMSEERKINLAKDALLGLVAGYAFHPMEPLQSYRFAEVSKAFASPDLSPELQSPGPSDVVP